MSPSAVLAVIVALPGALFGVLAIGWLLGWTPGERPIARLTALVYSGLTVLASWIGWHLAATGAQSVQGPAANWFQAGQYHFELALVVDRLSWPLLILTILLIGLVGVFSVRYLHRDRGYYRFFLLLHLFAFGSLLVLSAGTFDLLLAGWELVGISSVLLIAFFDQRPEPVRNGIRVFAFYRIADLGLLIGLYLLHTSAHTTRMAALLQGSWPNQRFDHHPGEATWIGLLLLAAAAGKSAQAPFSGWLPRAMEGPTPSSAIFYGAISVHLGAYLLLRAGPILHASPWATAAVIGIGGFTAVFATLVHRACTDAKTSLAYAGMAQLGVIFVEIGCGYPRLALAHIGGHAVVRTLQFLRAPSMLHDYHRIHSAAGGHLGRTGEHYHQLLPEAARLWLYRAALERGYYDPIVDRIVIAPVSWLARLCESLEPASKPAQEPGGLPPALRTSEGRLAERMES